MSSSSSTLSSVLGLFGDVAGTVGDISNYYDEKDYNERSEAYQREIERIENANRIKKERVARRNEVMNMMGGGWESRSPTQEKVPGTMPAYSPSSDVEIANVTAGILNDLSDMIGSSGSSSGGSSGTGISKALSSMGGDSGTTASTRVPQVDTNTIQPQPTDSREAYLADNRYKPSRQYLTREA